MSVTISRHFVLVLRDGEKPRLIGPFRDEHAAGLAQAAIGAPISWTLRSAEPR